MFRSLVPLLKAADVWLAGHPHSVTAGVTIGASLLARFGLNLSATDIALVASAAVALLAATAKSSVSRNK